MTQELGRIGLPAAEQYAGKRKLFLVPLVYEPPDQPEEGQAALARYWEQARSQVASLESKLGAVRHIYHETVVEGGTEGLQRMPGASSRSHAFAQEKCQEGAALEATEDEELLAEILDLQRCLSFPFASTRVAQRLHEWLGESSRKRYEHIARRIDETLQATEAGLLLIGERHQVQFPADVEVFYVSPPALDQYRRWLESWIAQLQKEAAQSAQQQEGDVESQPQ